MTALIEPGRCSDRRQFLGRTATAAGALVGVTALAIIGVPEIAEALAVTTYTSIIDRAPFFSRLASDDQGYLRAAREEEMSHYLLEEQVLGKPSPFTTFYYPPKMFGDSQTTLNVLVTLEDAFIAAYLVGVRDFSNANLRVTAVTALTPFLDKSAAAKAGFDTSKPYKFTPLSPTLPEPLGDFHSFIG